MTGIDYEPCSMCEHDHGLEYEHARALHEACPVCSAHLAEHGTLVGVDDGHMCQWEIDAAAVAESSVENDND